MERIEFGGVEIPVDVEATQAYRDKYCTPCGCSYCRNFLKAFPEHMPEIVRFLERFGIQADLPIEIMEYGRDEAKAVSYYAAFYAIRGELPAESLEGRAGDLPLLLYRKDSHTDYCNTDMPNPCFILRVDSIPLPWVLGEDYE